jgi:thiol-disulfide isomerase/thioredoxin
MKKKFRYVVAVCNVLIICFIWYVSYIQISKKKNLYEKIIELPKVELFPLSGNVVYLNEFNFDERILFMYFNSGCDLCQFELEELEKHMPEFENTMILLVSSEPFNSLRKLENQFLNYSNVEIFQCPFDSVQKYFGKVYLPTTFIYGIDGKLLKRFNGPTRIDEMIIVLRKGLCEQNKLDT